MGTKAKTRFVAALDGSTIELFSIREQSPDRLLISLRSPPQVEVEGKWRALREQHCSIHPTNAGRDTSITLKQEFQDGTKLDYVTMIHNTASHLLWPVYARRVGVSPDQLARCPPERAKDTRHKVAEYSGAKANLIFSLFIARPGYILPDRQNGITVWDCDLSLYKLIINISYVNVPSIPQGDLSGMTTSMPTTGIVDPENHLRIYRESLLSQELFFYHLMLTENLRQKLLNRLEPILGTMAPSELQSFLEFSSFVTAEPIVK